MNHGSIDSIAVDLDNEKLIKKYLRKVKEKMKKCKKEEEGKVEQTGTIELGSSSFISIFFVWWDKDTIFL